MRGASSNPHLSELFCRSPTYIQRIRFCRYTCYLPSGDATLHPMLHTLHERMVKKAITRSTQRDLPTNPHLSSPFFAGMFAYSFWKIAAWGHFFAAASRYASSVLVSLFHSCRSAVPSSACSRVTPSRLRRFCRSFSFWVFELGSRWKRTL